MVWDPIESERYFMEPKSLTSKGTQSKVGEVHRRVCHMGDVERGVRQLVRYPG